MSKLTLKREGDTTVIATRRFAAPPESVFRAHTDAALIQQWMLGPDGWTMPECECDPRPGGKMYYKWENSEGQGFSLTGEFIELDPPHRILHVERMHMPNATPDNRVETRFTADGDGTLMVMHMSLPDKAACDAMLASGMEHGMAATYDRLDGHLARL